MNQLSVIDLNAIRTEIRRHHICDETTALDNLVAYLDLTEDQREKIVDDATEFVRLLRRQATPGMMETFLSEYGLSTEEGIALMCLAEALLRVPDEDTIDVLIHDKIAPSNWSQHLGHSTSPLVNVSTWALMLTGKVISLEERESWDVVSNVRQLIKRAGEPVIRKAVGQAMKTLGHQFVLGRNIDEAVKRARQMEEKGYQYSYDMLGEAARTAKDASRYFLSYSKAIARLSEAATNAETRDNPGISIKLSALHPRYEFGHKKRVLDELVPRVVSLAIQAKNAGMGFNIDAEEADRLDLSLDVIEAVMSVPDLAGWDGFGVVVQAYGPRAFYVLDWCYALSVKLDRKIMIRLVKGAYWDTEIKLAQVEGLDGYPVFTRKSATDVSYMACAKKLLSMTDRIYPQFATHNAHTVMSILELADGVEGFEFQRLHGMGEALHELAREKFGSRCRIYAPVGIHEDLLAYLVRRLLENGANSSFVNQVFDEKVPARHVVRDPIGLMLHNRQKSAETLPLPVDIFPDGRKNSAGVNFSNPEVLKEYEQALKAFQQKKWSAGNAPNREDVINPADLGDVVGEAEKTTTEEIIERYGKAKSAFSVWNDTPVRKRAAILRNIANEYENNWLELSAILTREAGKTPMDCVNEVREAVDFCRYYADQAEIAEGEGEKGRGVFACISPWNFPLAIFTGQIVAALVSGNTVIAKPAPQTPLIAAYAVNLMHKAGLPEDVLQLVFGGAEVGQSVVELEALDGLCFTGSTATAKRINTVMAERSAPDAPLIAETGGLNAMIVDSTALPEQAVQDIVTSAFQSAGQRCSALRILYVQEDIADKLVEMLTGAMDELEIGNPACFSTDVGPVIDKQAMLNIEGYLAEAEKTGKLVKQLEVPKGLDGNFVAPALIKVSGIEDLHSEVFGPVLHIATYKAAELEDVLQAINSAGYGLTLGLHTRVEQRVQAVSEQAHVGNLYVNRNQIGAVVGVQPFGGEGLSGTGPKAGGPLYLYRFRETDSAAECISGLKADLEKNISGLTELVKKWQLEAHEDLMAPLNRRLKGYEGGKILCPGPTGERNQLSQFPRGVIWIEGANWKVDFLVAIATGNKVLLDESSEGINRLRALLSEYPQIATQVIFYSSADPERVFELPMDGCCISHENSEEVIAIRRKLAQRSGKIIPILDSNRTWREYVHERCLSVDTTASGGNAALLANAAE